MTNQTLTAMGQPPMSMQPGFGQDIDLRAVDPRLVDPRRAQQMGGNSMDLDMRMMPNQMGYDRGMQSSGSNQRFQNDPRQRGGNDPRDPRQKAQQQQKQQQQQQQQPSSLAAQLHHGIPNDASDQEKAALIMQVLKLTDEQIAILPPEQRASILLLKEQIAKSRVA